MNTIPTSNVTTEKKWQALSPTQRRVLGVLVEKAKTTPENYPLTLNSLTTASNQKNNRDPVSSYTTDQVEQALEELRSMGAAMEIQGSGRVAKFKHCLYEWLGVDKVELAVMAELFLRGEQTLGELRGRASRMEPIADLQALRPIWDSLKSKGLVMELTPEGRGQVVSHALYKDREMAELRSRSESRAQSSDGGESDETRSLPEASRSPRGGVTLDMFNELQVEVAELRAELARLRSQLESLIQ